MWVCESPPGTHCGPHVFQTVLELDKLDLTEPVRSCCLAGLRHILLHFHPFYSLISAVPQTPGEGLTGPEEGEGGGSATGDGE